MNSMVVNSRRTSAKQIAETLSRASLLTFALMTSAASMHAVNLLTVTPTTPIVLTCSTANGPGTAVSVTIKPVTALTGSNTIVVTFAAPTGGVAITAPSSTTLTAANSAAGLIYSVNMAAGCAGAASGASTSTITFKAGGTNDVTSTANITVTAATTPLVASPTPITLTCTLSGSTYTPAAAQTISVTSAAIGGTNFTIDTASGNDPAWVALSSTSGGRATATPITFTIAAASGCGGFTAGSSNSFSLHLVNAPAPDKTIPVTLKVVPPSTLSATPASPTLTYVKGSGAAAKVDVNITSTASTAPFFSLDTTSLPIWLTADAFNGTTPKSLRFSSTNVADSLAPGTYSASLRFRVSGFTDRLVPISLLITNGTPKLTMAESTSRNINWSVGATLPTVSITAVSSDSPISYVITTGGGLSPVVAPELIRGLAYSFGTQIPITFDPSVFASATPGTVLTGTVTLTWGSPAQQTVITINVTVLSVDSSVTGISPASLPTAASGQTFTVVLTGNGFVASSDPSQKTRVGILVNNAIVTDTNISANVINASNIILTITVPTSPDAYLPFALSGPGGSVPIGVCNPIGGTCLTPTGTANLSITAGPIIQTVTSASSFIQPNPGTPPTVSPYSMLSIFGTGFCSSNATGCNSNQVLYGATDASFRYGTSLSPDPTGATQRLLKVAFQTRGSSPTLIGYAPILVATNSQINILAPSAIAGQTDLDVVVTFGYGSGATLLASRTFQVAVAPTSPGMFSIGADGQGSGAILNALNYSLVTPGKEAGVRTTGSDSDNVVLYMTGLGVPDSTADNASTGSSGVPADCVSISSFLTSLNALSGGTATNLDGTVIQSVLLNTGRFAPCMATNNIPTVTIGGKAATVTYAGWVADSIGGLYQVNVHLPGRSPSSGTYTDINGANIATINAPVQLPIVVTSNSVASQAGVSIAIAPRLKVTAPTALTGTVGTAWASTNNAVVATQGQSPYQFAIVSGVLPTGLALNPVSGAITGNPGANTAGAYALTVKATDSANIPVTGQVTFTVTIAGGLVATTSVSAPTSTFGSANASLTTIQASGGIYPYSFAITTPSSLPTGMTIDPVTGVIGILATTPAGTYDIVVTATDSTTGTPLTGTISFSIVIALNIANTSPTAQTNGTTNVLFTASATGNTGTVAWTLLPASTTLGFVINSSTGAVTAANVASAIGSATVTVIATDSASATGATGNAVGQRTVSVTVN